METYCRRAADFKIEELGLEDSIAIDYFKKDPYDDAEEMIATLRLGRTYRKYGFFSERDLISEGVSLIAYGSEFTDEIRNDFFRILPEIDSKLEKLGYYREDDFDLCIWNNLSIVFLMADNFLGQEEYRSLRCINWEELDFIRSCLDFNHSFGKSYETIENPTKAKDDLFAFLDKVMTSRQANLLKELLLKAGFAQIGIGDMDMGVYLSSEEQSLLSAAIRNLFTFIPQLKSLIESIFS
ncbi:hypothetical protein IJJ36_03625 [Candidatus Saccharibacteria bacterium]|nr:hypothetical protein [Candidatus Saccharibacteria bacterium]